MSKKEKTPEQTSQQPVFSIEKIYLKDLSLEVPHAPQIFWKAENLKLKCVLLLLLKNWKMNFIM